MSEVCITLLVENTVHRRGLLAEHGLSFHIRTGQHTVLFDTGQTDLLLQNAATLNNPLTGLDAVVLSHGHYDHTGGLAAVCGLSPDAPVFLHPEALEPKFSADADGSVRPVGMPPEVRQILVSGAVNTVPTTDCREIVPGLFVTGEIPRRTDFEDVGGRFFLDDQCRRPDPLRDDQALFFDTSQGVVVVLGCGHAGVVNTLLQIEQLTGGARIHSVIGGMHLLHATSARLERTAAALRERDVHRLVPLHCTGWLATAQLWQAFPQVVCPAGVGTVLTFTSE
jgi:7,8-dihydropterin-6-yl-methyl-4-(beta-D-ribofuranosyl)aminobenzene 5'-phosphate synthase